MKNITFAATSVAIILGLSTAPSWAQNLSEIGKRFETVKKVVDDPLTDEGGIRKALRELEQLSKVTGELEEADLEPGGREAKLAAGISETLKQVRSRLPAASRNRTEARPGFPVPKFEDTELLANASSQLHDAQMNLARYLRKSGELDEQSEKLLLEVSKAQEGLAWEAGWPFTKQEAAEVKEAGKLTEEVYASRLLRGIERVNKQVAQEIDANGRATERPFVIHQPASKNGIQQLSRHLDKLRQVSQLPDKAGRKFNAKEAEVLKN